MHPDHRKIVIAIDGFSSCGKSTLARALAKRLGYIHIDSGAMYRAVTLYVIRNHVDINDPDDMAEVLRKISIHLSFENHGQVTWLNHVSPEANSIQVEVEKRVQQGPPPDPRLRDAWRQVYEDLVWSLINDREFVWIP